MFSARACLGVPACRHGVPGTRAHGPGHTPARRPCAKHAILAPENTQLWRPSGPCFPRGHVSGTQQVAKFFSVTVGGCGSAERQTLWRRPVGSLYQPRLVLRLAIANVLRCSTNAVSWRPNDAPGNPPGHRVQHGPGHRMARRPTRIRVPAGFCGLDGSWCTLPWWGPGVVGPVLAPRLSSTIHCLVNSCGQ